MAQHIGIIACSAEGAALCYRTVCLEGAQFLGALEHPEVSMHTHSFAAYMRCIDSADWPGVGELMLASAHKLARSEEHTSELQSRVDLVCRLLLEKKKTTTNTTKTYK